MRAFQDGKQRKKSCMCYAWPAYTRYLQAYHPKLPDKARIALCEVPC